jgi:hypothetical protein
MKNDPDPETESEAFIRLAIYTDACKHGATATESWDMAGRMDLAAYLHWRARVLNRELDEG